MSGRAFCVPAKLFRAKPATAAAQQHQLGLFSLHDQRTEKAHPSDIALERVGQYRGAESRAIGRVDPTSMEIRVGGKLAISRAQRD